MMENIKLYNAARQDIYLNDIPGRNEEGYKPNRTQRAYLNKQKYGAITTHSLKIQQLDENISDLRKETIAYQVPADIAIAQGNQHKDGYNPEIEEVKDNIKLLERDLKKYDDDMLNRGIVPEEQVKESEPVKAAEKRQKQKVFNWKAIGAFLLIWGAGETFMTYVQYNGLRYDKSVESIVARSIAFAVVLFLIHLVAHWNKLRRRIIYMIFLGVSFFMVFCMLFLPLILNQLYPEASTQAVTDQWSLNKTNVVAAPSHGSANPFWVDLYRKNDLIPGILSFLFFIIMTSFTKRGNKPPEETPAPQPEQPVNPIIDEVGKRRNYYLTKIRQEKDKLARLEDAQKLSSHSSTETLHQIFRVLQEKQKKEQALTEERDQLVAARQILMNEVQSELAQYETEFREAINNDPVKSALINAGWPTEDDIINFYKIRTK
ncbi:MAG: hypothetical protein U0U70_04245 [Chitinophagaceae bacterium]